MAGQSLYAENVVLTAGIKLISDPKTIVVHLSERSTVVEEAPVVAAAEGEAAATDAAPAGDAEKKDA
jgi:large subunit ribosomal protein L25